MIYYTDSFPGRTICKNGKEFLYFGGTAYLGLQTDVDFQNIYIDNIRQYGTNLGASRKSNVQLSIFNEAEQYLTDLVGSESCTTLSSGFLAGQLVAQSLFSEGHGLFYAPNTHAALFNHGHSCYGSYKELDIALKEYLAQKEKTTPVVLLDSVDFLGVNYPKFKALQTLSLEDVILVVDDSHGIGIVGENGGGVFKKLAKFKTKELIVCCSLGKGFGIQAGAIFGTQQRIETLRKTAFFGGASPAAPAGLGTLIKCEELYEEKRAILNDNINFFIRNLHHMENFDFMDGHPAFSFSNEPLVQHLERNNIIITNFRYPNETSSLKSRIVLSASHKKEDIQYLIQHLNTLS